MHVAVVLLFLAAADPGEAVSVEDPARVVDPNASVEELLRVASEAYESLDYEVSLELANAALQKQAITDEQRVKAYELKAGSNAVMGRPEEAQKDYRLLIRLRPGFHPPDGSPPKIMGAWNVVEAEEALIRNTVRQAERDRLVQSISVEVVAPVVHPGGRALDVRVHLTDPLGGVKQLVLAYRTQQGAEYSTLPFVKKGATFLAHFPSSQTASATGMQLEYAVLARDASGDLLLSVGDVSNPRAITITPGQVPTTPLWRQPVFLVVMAAGASGVALVTTALVLGGVVLATGAAVVTFLIARGDGTPSTPLGRQRFP